MKPPLIVASSLIADGSTDGPRLDYVQIARQLDGSLCGYDLSRKPWYARARRIEIRLKLDIVEAIGALRRLPDHGLVLSLSEKIAIPLVALMRLTGKDIPHIVIAHKLSTGFKTPLLRMSRLHRAFARIICLSRAQADYAAQRLGVAPSKVHFVHDKVDHQFFRPAGDAAGDYVLSVGQEQRDYDTLRQAAAGTGLKLVIVASSPWSTSRVQISCEPDVEVLSRVPFTQLRELYAGARLVVTPLFDVDYAAGVNALLEAMAMAKPVIVSRTRGIADYISEGETGVYVTPRRVDELRDAMRSLWHNAAECRRLAANARQAVETTFGMDDYVARIAAIARSASASPAAAAT